MNHIERAIDVEELFQSEASKMIMPLLDALNWNGDKNKLYQLVNSYDAAVMANDLVDIMANLSFKHQMRKSVKLSDLDQRSLPILLIDGDHFFLVIQKDDHNGLVFNSRTCRYENIRVSALRGDAYSFTYIGDLNDNINNQQNNWFTKLMLRFTRSFKTIIVLTFFMTLLGLLVPLFVILIYDQIATTGSNERLLVLTIGVFLYFTASLSLEFFRSSLINYMSVRMGSLISRQTFKRLLYLTPGYTETASISAQISRIKDFENLKRFTNSGIFINIIELVFSLIYVGAIFYLGGWIGIIPIVTFLLVLALGILMRPFNKVNAEKSTQARGEQQRQLLEILKNTQEIKTSGMKAYWIQKNKDVYSKSIYRSYEQHSFVSLSNNIIYFVTNASVIVLIYGGVLRVFDDAMTTGALIGTILLYWKVLSSIRGASSLFIQVGGLKKSIQQINRFMKLPQDSTIKENMILTSQLKGKLLFKDVSIRYSKTSKAALINVNFKVDEGQILGIKGHDGAGKTTVLKLVLGMYFPQGGRIIIDNLNIKQLEPLTLRQSLSYAPERDMIFQGTIRANFKNVNPRITDETIVDISKETGLIDYLIAFDYTLDTYLTGKILDEISPSFKKLFSLSRLLARDARLYLIDEPENHLNKDELHKVVEMILTLSKYNKTVLVATKSEEILEVCHQVLSLNQGRGTVKQEGEYYGEEKK